MKIVNTQNQNIETNENIILEPDDTEILTNLNVPFSDILSEKLGDIASNSIQDISLFDSDFNYDSVAMSLQDAMFFINLTHEAQFSIETPQNSNFQNIVQTEIVQNTVSRKTIEVTNQLTSLIEKAKDTQKPVRISFDNDVSVVLKIDKHGKVTAEFIPGNIEVENYLKNNIAALKQKFDEQNLPYNELFYRQSSKQNRNKKQDKGEA